MCRYRSRIPFLAYPIVQSRLQLNELFEALLRKAQIFHDTRGYVGSDTLHIFHEFYYRRVVYHFQDFQFMRQALRYVFALGNFLALLPLS